MPDVVGALSAVAQAVVFTQARRQFHDFAQRVKQQADVGREMHVRLNHKGVAPPTQRCACLFFYQNMSGAHHHLVDLVQQFRREQSNLVFERLKMGRIFIKCPMPQHLPDRAVLIHTFVQPVIIDVQIESQHAAHKNIPQCHSGTTIALVYPVGEISDASSCKSCERSDGSM